MAEPTASSAEYLDQRFQLLVDAVTDYAIYMLDPGGHVATWNPGAQRFKGYQAQEIIGQHFSRFFRPEDREAGVPQRALATALNEGRFEAEAWRVRKDGTPFWAHVVIDPIHDEAGKFVGFAKITRDITDRRNAQIELEEARAALFQSQKLQALGELTGGIAHDFNNLMTVIRGSAELLRRKELTPAKRERYLDAILETADRAATLTDHLLAFGRRQALKPEVVDLNLRIDAFAEVISRTLGSNVDVQLDLARDLWAVEVDLAQFENALLNAAINARDAMPEGGRITIATMNVGGDPDHVCVSLSDTGSGMSKEVLARVFEPFFTTKPVGRGTGLGLSQIHGFAAQAGGRAEIDSVEGEGTTVRLFLPRSDKLPLAQQEAEVGVGIPAGLGVLLVEDNDQVRLFAQQLLEEMNCEVTCAANAEEALALIDTRPFDLVFTDVVMPGMSGVEMARQIRRAHPALPILLASGYSEEIIQGATLEFRVVRKPYGAEALGTAILFALKGA